MSATDELFALLDQVGAAPTLYGKPVTVRELKVFAEAAFVERVEALSMSVTLDCTSKCEAAPSCAVCHLTKKPIGRSAPLEMANGLCDDGCPGYRQKPQAGHLWPGELVRSREG